VVLPFFIKINFPLDKGFLIDIISSILKGRLFKKNKINFMLREILNPNPFINQTEEEEEELEEEEIPEEEEIIEEEEEEEMIEDEEEEI